MVSNFRNGILAPSSTTGESCSGSCNSVRHESTSTAAHSIETHLQNQKKWKVLECPEKTAGFGNIHIVGKGSHGDKDTAEALAMKNFLQQYQAKYSCKTKCTTKGSTDKVCDPLPRIKLDAANAAKLERDCGAEIDSNGKMTWNCEVYAKLLNGPFSFEVRCDCKDKPTGGKSPEQEAVQMVLEKLVHIL